ncbi:NAD(P)/FAD-dependent oxidoreductase [Malacoplasma penetrans]|uniref:Ferredoxin--NADP reductase n=1 Tax=Malacoplasma penetrans (strain HF-2) TaxID=272633 RepID=FENR_MALP2|nr:NAD(P)/FAD-dependent oxidoreductase [Malacoplasma penetrans]Q8EWR4.1 RecName: Full=Ferredoxin--NADP reductase; Short=FNR; Short=Fd-NADP(+) reductase [Malacoplasma penetrans HF-2]RXY97007.1 NAD(P)/FAD-dependent oxidoreductase [Malacoplasma penetrans]BAC43930.1 thioredoxin reductase [Malacoplasma penetrans HF-2]
MNEDLRIYDVAIVGGGAGGIFASTISNYFNLNSILIEKKSYLGGQPMELYPNKFIYDFPCFFEIKSSDVIKKLIQQNKEQKNSNIQLDTDILNITWQTINEQELFLFETNKNSFYAKKIILASGNGSFNPRKLEINNEPIDSPFIHYSLNLETEIYKNKKILVLGGGDSAVEWANYFVEEKITNNVAIIHRRNEYRSSSFMIDCLSKNNILQKLNYEIIDFNESNKTLTIKHKETEKEQTLPFDYVLVQYGQISSPINIELLNQINKEKGKYVIDLNQKTNIKNIYAIGDATHFYCKPNTIITACAEAVRALWHISKNKKDW